MQIDLSTIIVNWNVRDLLRDCLHSVLESLYWDGDAGAYVLGERRIEVLVVDNASSDGSAAMVRAEFPNVVLIASETNLGFVGANNVALERARGRYLLLLNPDTVIVGGALATLMEYMDAHPETGICGPLLQNGDGSLQSSRRRFPTLWQALWESTILERWFPNNPWAHSYRMEDTPVDDPQVIDWVTGACMMVRAEAAASVGGLDPTIFMYSEELDWCRRMANAGWAVAYVPGAAVVHFEGRSSEQVAAARQMYFDTSKVYYFRKHHGVLAAEVLRLSLLAGHLVALTGEAGKMALGHKIRLRRQRIAAYWRIVRSGLRASRPRGRRDG